MVFVRRGGGGIPRPNSIDEIIITMAVYTNLRASIITMQ